MYDTPAWASLESHKAAVASKEAMVQLMKDFSPIRVDGVYVHDITFNNEPYPALNAPTTEIAVWTLKEDTDRSIFQEKLDAFIQIVKGLDASKGVRPGGWGPVAQNDRQFCVMLGWDSLEVRVTLGLHRWIH